MLSVSTDSMMRPGTMKAAKGTPPISVIRGPMAEPNTTKSSEVVSTGVRMLCTSVRKVRFISKQ